MAKERANPPFDVRKVRPSCPRFSSVLANLRPHQQLSIAMHGSRKHLLLKEKFMAEISRDPAFYLADIYDLSKDQIRERTMEKFASLVHYVTTEPLDVFNYRMQVSPPDRHL